MRCVSHILTCCLCVLGVVCALCAQQGTLPTPWKELRFPVAIDPPAYSFTKLESSYLWKVRRTLTTKEQEDDVIELRSLVDGSQTFVPFWLKGAKTIWIEDATLTNDLTVLLVGSFSTPEAIGVANSSKTAKTSFVVGIDVQGRTMFDLNVGSYEPSQICAAGDGNIWVLGQDVIAEATGNPYSLLRKYSTTGKLLGFYLNRGEIHSPALVLSTRRQQEAGVEAFRMNRVLLRCGEQSVGVYLGVSQTWTEVRLRDGYTQTWNLTLPAPRALMTGLSLMSEHVVYASFRELSFGSIPEARFLKGSSPNVFVAPYQNSTGVMKGLYVLNLIPNQKANWQEIPGTISYNNTPGVFARLIGSDGSSLVCLRTPQQPESKIPTLIWVKP